VKWIRQKIVLLLLLGIIGIQFTLLVDEPAHFFSKDPDCPMCLAYQTPLLFQQTPNFDIVPTVLTFLIDFSSNRIDTHSYFLSSFSRAPPNII
jgi:hypothetical protein